jgi:hypothetical protein
MGNWEIGTAAKILIALVIIALVTAVVCLAFPEVGGLVGGGLTAATFGVSGMIVAAGTGLLMWGAQSGLTMIVVFAGVIVVWSLLWILLFRKGINKVKEKVSGTPAPATPQPVMTQPSTVIVREQPASTTEESA